MKKFNQLKEGDTIIYNGKKEFFIYDGDDDDESNAIVITLDSGWTLNKDLVKGFGISNRFLNKKAYLVSKRDCIIPLSKNIWI